MNIGRCSNHRLASDFKVGDRVRVVCTGGRKWVCGIDHLGNEFVVDRILLTDTIANYNLGFVMLVGELICDAGGTYYHRFLPRALEIVKA
jgi:hypothetical protein